MAISLKPLSEQVMVITGASSGIGLATAEAAAEAGAKLVLAARSAETLREIVDRLGGHTGDVVEVVADVTEEGAVERIAEKAIRSLRGHRSESRQINVGVMSTINSAIAKMSPGLAKKLQAKQADRQHYDEPPRAPEGTLYEAGESGHTHGSGPASPGAAPSGNGR